MNHSLPKPFTHLSADISEVLFTGEQIRQRVVELGQEITQDYGDSEPVLVGVLKGVLFFMSDLLRAISTPVVYDFLAVSSYSSEARSQGLVRLVKDLDFPITGRDVIFVEDVIDTGLTLNYLLRNLGERRPKSLEVCVLFNKPAHRLLEIPIKYKGFDLPDRFVVGYGLDYGERYRNLPFVGLLSGEAYERMLHRKV